MQNLLNFFHEIEKLKKLKRAGWVLRKIPDPESVADHSWRTAVMALVLAKEAKVDQNKCVKMALVHELAEIIIGDLTPYDHVSEAKKYQLELNAFTKLLKNLKDKEMLNLWLEMEQHKTPEAKLVQELDRLELLFQAAEYQTRFPPKGPGFERFWLNAKGYFKIKPIKVLYKLLESQRKK